MTPLLEVRNLSIHFGGIVAADSINLSISPGDKLAIIGPNGAGKTTFLNICTGYLSPVGGTVRFDGRDITRMAPRNITQLGVARAFQIPQLFLDHCVETCASRSPRGSAVGSPPARLVTAVRGSRHTRFSISFKLPTMPTDPQTSFPREYAS